VAKNPKPIFKEKGRVFTYEEWSPVAGSNPFYVKELDQAERINLIRETTSPEEFPQRLSKIASKFPGMSVGGMVGMAQFGADAETMNAIARLDSLSQQKGFVDKTALKGANMVPAGKAGYDYLQALGKTEETASEKDKQDAWYFSGLKGATRYLLTGLYTPLQLVTNTARQLDAAYNVWADKGQTDKGPVVAGDKALDFSQIFKDTYLYQNLVENKSLGEGYFWGGEAVEETERIAAQVATVNGKAYTPGRAIEGMVGIDPGERGYGVMSGIIDGVIAVALDPVVIAGRLKNAKDIATARLQTREGSKIAGELQNEIIAAEEQAIIAARKQAQARTQAARDRVKLNETQYAEEHKILVEQARIQDKQVAQGKLANGDRKVTNARKRAGLDTLYDQRERLMAQIDEFKTTREVLVRDAQESKVLTGAAGAKFLREQVKNVDSQIDSALDKIYVQRDPIATQILSHIRDDIDANAERLAKIQLEETDFAAQRKLVDRHRAGLLESSTGFRTNLESAKQWFSDGNADELFQAIADEDSPTAIMKLANGRWGAEISAELSRARTIDEVEQVLLPRIGLKVNPEIQRGVVARYVAEPMKDVVMRSGVARTINEKIGRSTKFLFDYMPTGRPIHLQDTEKLVEETRRWLVAARWTDDEIAPILDELILSDNHNYSLRQGIVISALEKTKNKINEEFDLSDNMKNALARAVTAYKSELSGLREYGSETAGDIFRKSMVVNGEEIPLAGKPTSVAQLAHEIVLPDVYALRELTGNLAKLSRYVDSKIGKDADVAERTSYAAARFARSVSDGFLRQILLVGRGAYITRNIMEMQIRSFLAGGQNIFTNPIATVGIIMSNKSVASKMSALAAKSDPYLVDVTGRRFLEQDINDYVGQDVFDSFIQTMMARGYSSDGRAVRGAVRSGEFAPLTFNGTNSPEYADALAFRLLAHRSDPMKRAIIEKKLPEKYQNLVATEKMTFEDAFIQAVRDGVWKDQVDILTKSVPEIQRALSTTEGMKMFFFSWDNSYQNQMLTETLGNVQWQKFIHSGVITEPKVRKVTNKETGEVQEIVEEKVIFQMGPDLKKNLDGLRAVLRRQLNDEASTEHANALQLTIPSIVKDAVDPGKYKKFADAFFRLAAKAETRAVYGPEYRIAYWNAVADLAPLMSREAAQKLLDDAADIKKTRVAVDQADGTVAFEKWTKRNPAFADIEEAARKGDGVLTAKQIDEYARDKASKNLANLFYDATQKKNIAYAMQLVVPFANAWANTIYKWGELASSPARFGTRVLPATRLFATLQSDESSVLYDITGTEHDPNQGFIHENMYGEKVFTIPLSGYLRTAFGLFGDPQGGDITMPVNSLNLVAAGASIPGTEIGLTPGIGTQWNLGYSFLPSSWKESVPPVLANMIAPYGDKTGNVLAPLPAWLQKVISGGANTDDAMKKFLKPIMAYEVTANPKYRALYDGTPLSVEERSTLQEELASSSMEQSRWQYFMQGLLQNLLPGTPVFEYYAKNENNDTFFQWQMAQAFNQLVDVHDGNYELAYAEYGTVFGRQAVMAAMSASEGAIFADDRAWQFASSNPEAFKAYNEVIPFFFAGSEFSTEYKRAMERRGFGKKLSAKELLSEADSLTIASVKGQLAIEAARNGYGADWIDEQMKLYKMDVLQGYEPEVTISTNKLAQRILKIESALQRPEFAGTPAGDAAIKYSQARAEALKNAQMRYPDRKVASLEGEDNADLRYQLEALGQQLSQNNPDFANLYKRVYLRELRKD
jgi:hypothetical protein